MEEALVLIRMEIRSLSLLGVIIPRADKVLLELTALQLKKAVFTTQKPVKKKKGSLLGWLMVLVIICASLPEIRDSLKDSLAPILEEEFGRYVQFWG